MFGESASDMAKVLPHAAVFASEGLRSDRRSFSCIPLGAEWFALSARCSQ
jgi:hypothetical protein